MIERIKELAEQVGFEFNSLGGTYTSGTLVDNLDKFAELIVRECIDKAFHNGHPDLEFLLKHFGVEE
jgi:hypothetical protein